MFKMERRAFGLPAIAAGAVALGFAGYAVAEEFPSKPIYA